MKTALSNPLGIQMGNKPIRGNKVITTVGEVLARIGFDMFLVFTTSFIILFAIPIMIIYVPAKLLLGWEKGWGSFYF